MEQIEYKNDYKKSLEKFMDEHKDILDSNVKRLVFLEGVLAKKLLNIQKRDTSGSAPFKDRLQGLKINEKVAKRLYPEMIDKLEQYNSNYYRQLEELIADYVLNSNFEDISNNELSFFFVTGMNQAHKFQFEKK